VFLFIFAFSFLVFYFLFLLCRFPMILFFSHLTDYNWPFLKIKAVSGESQFGAVFTIMIIAVIGFEINVVCLVFFLILITT
jgi:hypothetical protein